MTLAPRATAIVGGRRRRGGRRRPGLALLGGMLAVLWLAAGLAGAARYVHSYYQYRGFAPLTPPTGIANGRVIREVLYSRALGHRASYLAYLPPGYANPQSALGRLPVLYLLHGSPGRPENFLTIAGMGVRLDELIARHQISPMMLVLPDGRIHDRTSTDTEWSNGSEGRYESFVLDVVHNADRRLPTQPQRDARVVAGYSEGGYGAVNLALHHPGVFAGIQAWSGYYVENRAGTFAHATAATLIANSPLDYAAALAPAIARDPLRVFLYGGKHDPDGQQLAPLTAELRAAGAQAAFALYPGGHDWGLWRAHAAAMIVNANHDFTHPPRHLAQAPIFLAQRELRAGRRAASAALAGERRRVTFHAQHLAGCRLVATAARSSAPGAFARMSRRGRHVVDYHLVRNCMRVPPSRTVASTLCGHLAEVIALARREVLLRRRVLTAHCLRALAARRLGGTG